MNQLLTSLDELLGTRQMAENVLNWIPNAASAAGILFAYWVVWGLVRRSVKYAALRANLDRTALDFLLTILKYAILSLGVVMALGRLGINTTSLLASIGIAGITVGFAAKDVISNMISGLFIFWDRPFVLGDLVEVGGHYGRVESITMRSTRVVTPDGKMLAVPNSVVINTTVASYTNFPHLRIDIPFAVAVQENLGRVRSILLSMCHQNISLLDEPAPAVIVTDLNDYNVGMQLQVWLDDEEQHIVVRQQLYEQVFEALRKAGVDMPFQTLSLTSVEIERPTTMQD
ncbi:MULTISPECIES: mechanosensitive ion channel family protein [unclassified Synechococcus]|uniref:mechanosensitive ion channel family protein n=2 Tax=Synechococcales TaxID=1890424 RepID=UPI0008FF476A|nr:MULTISPECIES: mechanosensitive ion channel family protein [unclassified Synechococcus]APD47946.1 mechanosensitive ion channel protein MscS [Synechococcus sp. SynAce01]TWB91446.1 small conductance mechanosensitive channel [Synechococcus sp. Ace-Pa]